MFNSASTDRGTLVLRNYPDDDALNNPDKYPKALSFSPDIIPLYGTNADPSTLIQPASWRGFMGMPIIGGEVNNVYVRGYGSGGPYVSYLRVVPSELILWPQVWSHVNPVSSGPVVIQAGNIEGPYASDAPLRFRPPHTTGLTYSLVAHVFKHDPTKEDEPIPSFNHFTVDDFITFLSQENTFTFYNVVVADPTLKQVSTNTRLRMFDTSPVPIKVSFRINWHEGAPAPDGLEVSLVDDRAKITIPRTTLSSFSEQTFKLDPSYDGTLMLNIFSPEGNTLFQPYSGLSLQVFKSGIPPRPPHLLGALNIIFESHSTRNIRFASPAATQLKENERGSRRPGNGPGHGFDPRHGGRGEPPAPGNPPHGPNGPKQGFDPRHGGRGEPPAPGNFPRGQLNDPKGFDPRHGGRGEPPAPGNLPHGQPNDPEGFDPRHGGRGEPPAPGNLPHGQNDPKQGFDPRHGGRGEPPAPGSLPRGQPNDPKGFDPRHGGRGEPPAPGNLPHEQNNPKQGFDPRHGGRGEPPAPGSLPRGQPNDPKGFDPRHGGRGEPSAPGNPLHGPNDPKHGFDPRHGGRGEPPAPGNSPNVSDPSATTGCPPIPMTSPAATGWWFRESVADVNIFPHLEPAGYSPDIQLVGVQLPNKTIWDDLQNPLVDFSTAAGIPMFGPGVDNYIYVRGHSTVTDIDVQCRIFAFDGSAILHPPQYTKQGIMAHVLNSKDTVAEQSITVADPNQFYLFDTAFVMQLPPNPFNHYCLIAEVRQKRKCALVYPTWPSEQEEETITNDDLVMWQATCPLICRRNITWVPGVPLGTSWTWCCTTNLIIPDSSYYCDFWTIIIECDNPAIPAGSTWTLKCEDNTIFPNGLCFEGVAMGTNSPAFAGCHFTGAKPGYRAPVTLCITWCDGSKTCPPPRVHFRLAKTEGLTSTSPVGHVSVPSPEGSGKWPFYVTNKYPYIGNGPNPSPLPTFKSAGAGNEWPYPGTPNFVFGQVTITAQITQ